MESLLNKKVENPKQLSPQTLAFVGDTVYDLLVRVHDVAHGSLRLNIGENVTEEEIDIYRRGRNAFTKNTPKNSSVADYHSATGLEALFGFLYLKGDIDRINNLFTIIIS